MNSRLEKGIAALVAAMLAMAATMFTLFPAVAEAQTRNTSTFAVEVRPGDSLWSISEDLLGPNATPRRTLEVVERIYALNRGRIGADPGMIFVGQTLLLPPAPSEQSKETPSPHEEKTTETSRVGLEDRAKKDTTLEVETPMTVQSGTEAKDSESSKRVTRQGSDPTSLPNKLEATPVPAVRMVASRESRASLVAVFLRTARAGVVSAVASMAETFLDLSADVRARELRLPMLVVLLLMGILATVLCAWTIRASARRKARKRELQFRKTYGSPYAAFGPFESGKDASKSEKSVPPSSSGSLLIRNPSEDSIAQVGLFAIARAKRWQVRRKQPLGLRQPSWQHRKRAVRGTKIYGLLPRQDASRSKVRKLRPRRAWTATLEDAAKDLRFRRKEEWEPGAALASVLMDLPLHPEPDHGEHLVRLKPHLDEALRRLSRLEQQRGLSDRELVRERACRGMLLAIGKEVE